MKLFNAMIALTALCNLACEDYKPKSYQPPIEFEFSLTGENGYELKAGAVYDEPCGFGRDGVTRTLVLTPWQLDCNGPKNVPEGLIDWKVVTINLDEECSESSMATAEQITETLGDGVTRRSFNHAHSHDVWVGAALENGDDNGTTSVSVNIEIYPRFQGTEGDLVGALTGTLPFCGPKTDREEPRGSVFPWWLPDTQ